MDVRILRNDIIIIGNETYRVKEFIFKRGEIVGIRLERIGKLVSER